MSIETPPSRRTERFGQTTLDRARAGDEHAFRDLVAPHRRELHVHCYRMLGSLTDAEDLVQETLAAAWCALDSFAGRSSLRSWLYRIATNRCLNAIRDSGRRPSPEPVPPFTPPEPSRRGEITWVQPYPDAWLDRAPGPEARYQARETVELAFIVALQRLSPRQTAALLLCDVLDFSTADTADMLDTSVTAVKGLLQRARKSVRDERDTAGLSGPPPSGSDQERNLAQRFASAFVANDLDTVVALLTDDAWLAMPPAPHEYHGPQAIVAFLRASAGWRGARPVRLLPVRANGQPAFAFYLGQPDATTAQAAGILVLTLAGNRICGITRFLDFGLPRIFGLPDTIN